MKRTPGKPWDGEGYSVSPYNFAPDVTQQYKFRKPMLIQDGTLMKMDHLDASRLYSPEEYLEVAELLDEAGFASTLFINSYLGGSEKAESMWAGFRAVAGRGLRMKVKVVVRPSRFPPGDYRLLDEWIDMGLGGLNLVYVGRDPREPVDNSEARREMPKIIEYAKKKGIEVIINHAATPLAELEPFIRERNELIGWGVDGFILSDTKGWATPDATRYLVSKVRAGLIRDVKLYYHAHDGFGTGTALALAAAQAGAYPEGSIGGIGDHGFAALEEVVMALECLHGVDTGIKLELLPRLVKTVERITGVTLPPWKAVSGRNVAFPAYPDLYADVVQGKKLWPAPYDFSLVGRRPEPVMWYALLADDAVKGKLKQMGQPTDDATVQKVKAALGRALDALGNRYPVMLDDGEVTRVCLEALRKQ